MKQIRREQKHGESHYRTPRVTLHTFGLLLSMEMTNIHSALCLLPPDLSLVPPRRNKAESNCPRVKNMLVVVASRPFELGCSDSPEGLCRSSDSIIVSIWENFPFELNIIGEFGLVRNRKKMPFLNSKFINIFWDTTVCRWWCKHQRG